jgi:uncharacterized alpha-E superfamily protein
MLSRVADCLFWMSRYLERAESVARLLNATFHRDLDLAHVTAAGDHQPWLANLAILQQAVPDGLAGDNFRPRAVAAWLSFELSNPGSIIGCVNRARNNARSIRGTIGPDVWRSINTLYWQLRDNEFETSARHSPFDYYQTVEAGCHLFQGVCDATLPHDEGWEFIRLGRCLERAERTLRLLAVKYEELRHGADAPILTLEWAGVLKSANAYEAYQRATGGRVDPERVIEFLLLDTACPRSVRFCLEEAGRAVASVEAWTNGRGAGRTDRVIGRVVSELKYAEPGQFVDGGLSARLQHLLQQCTAAGRTIHEQYMLVQPPGAAP